MHIGVVFWQQRCNTKEYYNKITMQTNENVNVYSQSTAGMECRQMAHGIITMTTTVFALNGLLDLNLFAVRYSNRKVGGIRFVRIGKLSFSFCITK